MALEGENVRAKGVNGKKYFVKGVKIRAENV